MYSSWVERRAAFQRFDAAHPEIYEALRRYALQAVAAGHTKIGIRVVWERMRWDHTVITDSPDFKLNNNHTAFYARKLMALEPELEGVFEIRGAPAVRHVRISR